MSVMALSCYHGNADAMCAMKKALGHLLMLRNADGSYGNGVYSTALVIQVTKW